MRYQIQVQLANNSTQLAQNSLQSKIDSIQSESNSCSPIPAPTRLVPRNRLFASNFTKYLSIYFRNIRELYYLVLAYKYLIAKK